MDGWEDELGKMVMAVCCYRPWREQLQGKMSREGDEVMTARSEGRFGKVHLIEILISNLLGAIPSTSL